MEIYLPREARDLNKMIKRQKDDKEMIDFGEKAKAEIRKLSRGKND